MNDKQIQEKYGLKDKRHGITLWVTMLLSLISVIILIHDLTLDIHITYKLGDVTILVGFLCIFYYALSRFKRSWSTYNLLLLAAIGADVVWLIFYVIDYNTFAYSPLFVIGDIIKVIILTFFMFKKKDKEGSKYALLVFGLCVLINIVYFFYMLVEYNMGIVEAVIRRIPRIVYYCDLLVIYRSILARKKLNGN